MLFINFLCLLYLMVLIDSHTISKSIDNDEKADDIFDSITDLDNTRNPKQRRDRFIHKYKPEEKDDFILKTVEAVRLTKAYSDSEKTTETTTSHRISNSTSTEHLKHHKSPKRRVGSFWRKFRGKDKKDKHDDNKERKRRIPKNKEYKRRHPTTKDLRNSAPRNKGRRKNRNQFVLQKPEKSLAKRDVAGNMLFSCREVKKYPTKLQIGITPHIDMPNKPYKVRTDQTSESLNKLLQSMTTQITRLKQIYGFDQLPQNLQPSYPSYDKSFENKFSTSSTTPLPKFDSEYPGTAQIEELLNDIKVKAIQMVAEQVPSVTDLITNTVTEATFEADPILTHIDFGTPGYYLSTFVSINEVQNVFGKRTVPPSKVNEFTLNDSALITNTPPHYIVARSIKEDTMTMARNVEDILQRNLKKIYHKVKDKVSSDFSKEIHKVKSTLSRMANKDTTTKPTTKTTPKPTNKCTNLTKHTKPRTTATTTPVTTAPRHTRGQHIHRMNRPHQLIRQHTHFHTQEATHPTPTYDDYLMLTLYEQMLAKTQEGNVLKLLTTADPVNKKRREHYRLSKRNPETLTDVKLREYLQKIYEEGINMPDYDYVEPSSAQPAETSTENSEGNNEHAVSWNESSNRMNGLSKAMPSYPSSVTQTNLDDTSYEGLSNKISYNDFVNGYKHYLKFQKEQGSQNFSNLVKYQAHRHHNVEDIGKFILNKIPQLPNRRKRFFDDTDIDYQEVSTKSDDNWFKKHFYLFIDNGPPKKFHTSQTVALKSAITDPELKLFVSTEDPMPRPGPRDQIFIKIGSDESETTLNARSTGEMNLDDLSRILDSIKDKQATGLYYRGVALKDTESPSLFNTTNNVVKVLPHNFIEKIFGNKRRRTPKKLQNDLTDFTESIEFYTDYLGNRLKRETTPEDMENVVSNEEVSEKEEPSTPRENYGNLKSNTKETNKYGYVDIDLVPQTVVVKLRDNTSKRSKIKDFFRRFHFKSNKTKKPLNKRQCVYTRRKTRFNPIKKLKNMFKVRTDDTENEKPSNNLPNYRAPNVPDYDMMTSHIDTFKPIKYDKPLSIDEMKMQIPNISDVITYESESTQHTSTIRDAYSYKLDESDRNLLYHYHIPQTSAKPATVDIISKPSVTTLLSSKASPSSPNTTIANIPPSNVMTVNVKTIKPLYKTTITPKQQNETSSIMTLEDMNIVLTDIQHKLAKTPRNFPRHSTLFYKRGTFRDTMFTKHSMLYRRPLEELTIKSKLTRIAKFPISKRHFKFRREEMVPQKALGNDYMSFHEGPSFRESKREMKNRISNSERMVKMKKPGSMGKKLAIEKYRYPDYFNDLLMWHNDILNLDKVPSPIWKSILKNIQAESGEGFTTPNMNNLVRELDEINEFLDYEPHAVNRYIMMSNASINATKKEAVPSFGSVRIPPKYANKFDKPDLIRSVAMDDKAIVTSNNVVIRGEAKVFEYNKPKVDRDLNVKGFVKKYNTLNVRQKTENSEDHSRIVSRMDSEASNEPAILVDTTMLAYDDDADSVTNGVEVKKLSRDSQKSTNAKTSQKGLIQHTPHLKTNKAPIQYYTTPLPMKSYEFNKFLKDNKMDVESVTSPMFELPTFIENWTPKAKTVTRSSTKIKAYVNINETTTVAKRKEVVTIKSTKSDNRMQITTPVADKTVTLTTLKPLPTVATTHNAQTNKSLRRDIFDDFDRYKRYSELYKFPRNYITIRSYKTTPNYYNMIKRKMKFFEKKAPRPLIRPTTDSFTLDPRNKEVEITIINFDDIEKMTTSYRAYDTFTMPPPLKKDDQTSLDTDLTERNMELTTEIPKPSDYAPNGQDAIHNELLYKDIFKEPYSTSSTTEFTPADFLKNTEYSVPTASLDHEPTKSKNPFDFLNRLPAGKMNMPKRVHISSHHYKYDIFYNEDKKRKPSNLKISRPKLSPKGSQKELKQAIKITPKRVSSIFRKGEPNTEVKKKLLRHCNKTRISRDASTVKVVTEVPSGSFVYDLKHLRRSTHVPIKERHRRLFRISALIQDRFKSLMKNTTAGKTAASTKRPPKPRCTCNCTGMQSNESTAMTKPMPMAKDSNCWNTDNCTNCTNCTKCPNKTECLEEMKNDGFKITCSPNSCSPNAEECPEHKNCTMCPKSTSTPKSSRSTKTRNEVRTTAARKSSTRICTTSEKDFFLKYRAKALNDTFYIEPDLYSEQMYYESELLQRPPQTTRPDDSIILTVKEHSDKKRDILSQNTFTAKDVAALEVIVDLMKNTLSYEEKDVASVFNNNFMQQGHGTKSVQHNSNDTTNSIQVHIAIPFDLQPGKKRSPLDPVRVRKVFSAKMSTPVDLEYQVHSFEGTMSPTVSTVHSTSYAHALNITNTSHNPEDGLSPGMYLLVDKPRSGYALKPVKAKIDLSALKTRQAAVVSTPSVASTSAVASSTAAITEAKAETTSLKSLAKVTLSKDFIAAVNKQLIEMYENMTRFTKDAEKKSRKAREVFNRNPAHKNRSENYINKRRIDWEAVKKYFGHDRVCNCKCKANKAMCRACAASDAVIDELTFEFDNLGNYMRDHCTEIQTFFWMNPSGGQKLRDSVSRIDKSLGDYYKRVKGKCQGRTCKTFATYIDKRHPTQIHKNTKVPKGEAVKHLMDDLSGIAEDLNKTVALKTCFNKKLKEEGEKFLRAINNCLQRKKIERRSAVSLSTKRKLIKNVYSLDNINVNIICNPEATSTTESFFPTTVQVSHPDSTSRISDHLFDYEIDDSKHKKRKGFKKLFPRKNKKEKLFTYYVPMFTTKKSKLHFKRQVDQMMTPLISDGGGSFWYEYLKGSTNEPRIVRESIRDSPKFGIAVLQTGGAVETPRPPETSVKHKPLPLNNIYMTVKTTPKKKMVRDTEPMFDTTTDYLSQNINQLLQLFGSLQDIEAMNMHSNRSTMFLNHKSTKSKKNKTKKMSKLLKTTKMHYRGPTRPAEPRPQPMNVSSTTIRPALKENKQNLADAVAADTKNPSASKIIPALIPEAKEAPAFDPKNSEDKMETSTKPLQADTTSSLMPTTTSNTPSTYSPDSNTSSQCTNTSSQCTNTSSQCTNTSSPCTNTSSPCTNTSCPCTNTSSPCTNTSSPCTNTSSPCTNTSSSCTNTSTPCTNTSSPCTNTSSPCTNSSSTCTNTSSTCTNSSYQPLDMGATTTTTTKKYDFVVADTRVSDAPAMSAKHTSAKTTKGFMEKVKTATFKFFESMGKGYLFNDIDTPTTIMPFEKTDALNFIDKISETEMNLLSLSETSQATTHMSPTIVIINEYDNQMANDILSDSNKDSEGYKNLLLSIIQYETNRLNDEWHRIAYGKDRDEDVKRSIIELRGQTSTTKAKQVTKAKEKPLDEHDAAIMQNLKALKNIELQIPEPKGATRKPAGLLGKLASKFGMRVVTGTKKKAGHKLNRDVAKNTRKILKNRKRKDRTKTTAFSMEEACDSRRTSKTSQICDIKATYDHIIDQQKKLPAKNFEALVKNISCFKYKDIESSFYIPYKSVGRRWDWIRNRRSLKLHFSRMNDDNELDDELDIVSFDNDEDSFERFVKGEDDIYRIMKRKKRNTSWENLDLGLRNIPPLVPDQNELYVMVGDTITLDCLPNSTPQNAEKQFLWRADRSSMLELDNVEVTGVKVVIKNVEPKNVGSYTCSQDNRVQRNVKVSVMSTPAFDVIFLPIYKTPRSCSYSDLRAIQLLGPLMSEESGCGDVCSVRIDEPVCQKDRGTNSSLVRSTGVISLGPQRINCSVQCRRDIISSLVMLSAANTPALSSIGVVISKDGVNETLRPCTRLVRPVVTHTLRKKDSNGHREYHKLASNLAPGKVNVVLICPAGYYLIHENKICASCPPNTSSEVGDNTCTSCPRGTRSDPGSAACSTTGTQPRRYDWWWYPPCGYMVACGSLLCGCGVCVALAMLVHVATRDGPDDEMSYRNRMKPKEAGSVTAAFANTPRTRPLSPSRVILARFFKPSLTSSRATDSQETKFELWKERNLPPPLPPIDFDI